MTVDATPSGRRGIATAVLLAGRLACVWYGIARYRQLNHEPMGLEAFFNALGAFIMWQLLALLPFVALWLLVRRCRWRSWWSIGRVPLIVSGDGWLLVLATIVALRLRPFV